ncbi:DUF4328 domain-containing protein [Streptomyces sp. NPDC005251]|uniref:DUF4328 domain-containing protein n=1 Tax=Streptomyces sp. NPDC005251 TaxID=3157166 RepID=UPI0033AE9D4F
MTMPPSPQRPTSEGPAPAQPMAEGPVSPQPAAQGIAFTAPLAPLPPLPSPHGPASLRSPVVLGKVAAALLGLVIAVDLFAIWADYTLETALGVLVDGGSGDNVWRRAEHAESLNAAVGYAQSAALVLAAVVFLNWFLRVRVNAEVFSPFGHEKSRAWVGWGWFVPVVNLWFPRRVMADIWDASRPAGARRGHGLVNAWWTFWIIGLLFGRASFGTYGKAETTVELQAAAGEAMIADALDIVAAVFAILVVLKLTRMQDHKAHEGPVASGI